MAQTINLPSLSPREAMADVFYRIAIGMDNKDPEIFKSALIQSKDTYFDVGGVRRMEGADAIFEHLVGRFAKITTTHHITNIRVDWKEGADSAYVTAHSLACHYRAEEAMKPDSKGLTVGGMYFANMVKDADGLWKIANVTLKMNWMDGDPSIVRGEQ
jgi:ketosteroid isomerase-like protein